MKTGSQIETDVFKIIKGSELATAIRGTIYREGMRPLNATTEDAVVSFMTGLDNQVQTGALNLNIYVPDIDNGSGSKVKNGARCLELEVVAGRVIRSQVPGDYRFSLGAIIQTFKAEGTSQHFVNAKIKFELITF